MNKADKTFVILMLALIAIFVTCGFVGPSAEAHPNDACEHQYYHANHGTVDHYLVYGLYATNQIVAASTTEKAGYVWHEPYKLWVKYGTRYGTKKVKDPAGYDNPIEVRRHTGAHLDQHGHPVGHVDTRLGQHQHCHRAE